MTGPPLAWTSPTTPTSREDTTTMPDLTPDQLLTRHRPALFRLMDAGALADVVELLVELDRFAARSTAPRHVQDPRPADRLGVGVWATYGPPWEQLLTPTEQHEAVKHDSEPNGTAVIRSLDVLETWLAGSVKP